MLEACTSPDTTLFDINIGTGETVVLENMTFRGWTTIIDADGVTGSGTIIVRNCRFENSTTAITADGSSRLIIEDSTITGCTTAIDGTGAPADVRLVRTHLVGNGTAVTGQRVLELIDCDVRESSVASLTTDRALWTIMGTTIADNAEGLVSSDPGFGPGDMLLDGCQILRNGTDGISIDNSGSKLTVRRSTIAGNTGHGLKLRVESATSWFHVSESHIEGNDDDGINADNPGTGCHASPSNYMGLITESQIVGNGDDGIEIDKGAGTCSFPTASPDAVRVALLRSIVSGNTDDGLVETSASSASYECELGHDAIFANGDQNELNTGTVCTGAGATANLAGY